MFGVGPAWPHCWGHFRGRAYADRRVLRCRHDIWRRARRRALGGSFRGYVFFSTRLCALGQYRLIQLACITNNHLSLTCSVCGHSALLPVSAAIDVFGETETVQHVVKRARCSRCRVKGAGLYQIVYVGQGWQAATFGAGKRAARMRQISFSHSSHPPRHYHRNGSKHWSPYYRYTAYLTPQYHQMHCV